LIWRSSYHPQAAAAEQRRKIEEDRKKQQEADVNISLSISTFIILIICSSFPHNEYVCV
jgi:hypothetical protein